MIVPPLVKLSMYEETAHTHTAPPFRSNPSPHCLAQPEPEPPAVSRLLPLTDGLSVCVRFLGCCAAGVLPVLVVLTDSVRVRNGPGYTGSAEQQQRQMTHQAVTGMPLQLQSTSESIMSLPARPWSYVVPEPVSPRQKATPASGSHNPELR